MIGCGVDGRAHAGGACGLRGQQMGELHGRSDKRCDGSGEVGKESLGVGEVVEHRRVVKSGEEEVSPSAEPGEKNMRSKEEIGRIGTEDEKGLDDRGVVEGLCMFSRGRET